MRKDKVKGNNKIANKLWVSHNNKRRKTNYQWEKTQQWLDVLGNNWPKLKTSTGISDPNWGKSIETLLSKVSPLMNLSLFNRSFLLTGWGSKILEKH